MPKNMSISVNGQSQVPPGFRFHPTEDELLQYYLRKKVSYEKIDLDVIRDVDLNKLEPWDIQEMCKIGTIPDQNDCYFFSHKDKKYPTGTRTNRATAAGFWKATGRDKAINSNCSRIGMRKTLVFYRGRAPHGQKSDWIIHEYRLDDNVTTDHANYVSNVMGEVTHEEGWVVCRIFKQKNNVKTLDRTADEPRRSYSYDLCNEGYLDQIVQQMGRTCKEETESNIQHRRTSLRQFEYSGINKGYSCHDSFFKLPRIDNANSTSTQTCFQPSVQDLTQKNKALNGTKDQVISVNRSTAADDPVNLANQLDASGFGAGLITNWAGLDHRLVACQQTEQSSRQPSCFGEAIATITDHDHDHLQLPNLRSSSSSPSTTTSLSQTDNYINPTMDFDDEFDLWSYAPSSSALLHDENGRITE